MKAATGELSLTVITVIAIGAVATLFWLLWNGVNGQGGIKNTIQNQWETISKDENGTGGVKLGYIVLDDYFK